MAKKTPPSETPPAKFPAKARKRAGDTAPATAETAETAAKKTARASKAVETDVAEVATTPVAAAPAEPTHDAIRQRAFELWRAHGGASLDNWLRAETELRGGR
jgi:hypothetical protein